MFQRRYTSVLWAGLSMAATVGACSSEPGPKPGDSARATDGTQGQIGLNLRPVSGVDLNVVAYRVTIGAGGALVKSGNLSVPGTEDTFSFSVALPVGAGYVLSLEAVSVDGKVKCAGSAGPFDVLANQGIDVTPTLTCVDISTGQSLVDVGVVTSACPDVTFDYVIAMPRELEIGRTGFFLSAATSASGTPLTYAWSTNLPSALVFTNPSAKDPSATCIGPAVPVLVQVTASNGECSKSLQTSVSCFRGGECGDGKVDAGETCDKALDPTCPADCVQQCGDGVVEGTEFCEPPNTNVCSATCQDRLVVCGDGWLSPGELCDPTASPTGAPPFTVCNQDCVPVFVDFDPCGNGILEVGETCDPGPGLQYTVDDCGGTWGQETSIASGGRLDDCQRITPAACFSCEQASECAELVGTALLSGNAVEGPALGTSRKALYNEVLDCVRDTHCATGLIIDCYCGTASGAQCDSGNGNGACRSVIERGVETTNPSDVQARLTNLTLGGGLAMARVQCDQNNCTQCL